MAPCFLLVLVVSFSFIFTSLILNLFICKRVIRWFTYFPESYLRLLSVFDYKRGSEEVCMTVKSEELWASQVQIRWLLCCQLTNSFEVSNGWMRVFSSTTKQATILTLYPETASDHTVSGLSTTRLPLHPLRHQLPGSGGCKCFWPTSPWFQLIW